MAMKACRVSTLRGPTMADYGDQVTLARVYEKISKKPRNTYFVGRIGLAKIAILRSKETAENGDAIWNIVLSVT